MTRTAPSGGFRIDTSGGANALAFDNIIFSDSVDEAVSMTGIVPLVESVPEALGSGSTVRVDTCEFRNFANGTVVLGSFSSNSTGSVVDVRSSVFVNNTGVSLLQSNSTAGCCAGAIDIQAMSTFSNVTIFATEFSNNNGTGSGGAVRIVGASGVDIIDSTFMANTAIIGGGVYVEEIVDAVDILGSAFRGNAATEDGGAIVVNRSSTSTFNIGESASRRSQFVMNQAGGSGGVVAGGSGGAVFASNVASVNVRSSDFEMNNSTGRTQFGSFIGGGALYYQDGVVCESLSITDAVFVGNEASEDGGAVRTRARNITVESSRFDDNTAAGDGGGIFGRAADNDYNDVVNLTIRHSSFARNSAFDDEGGAVCVLSDGGSLDVFGSIFEENRSGDGGAIFTNRASDVVVRNTTFVGNVDFDDDGGAVAFSNSETVSISESNFTKNTALVAGGAVDVSFSEFVDIRDSIFANNSCGTSGGAVRIRQSEFTGPGAVSIARTSFTDNVGGTFGGALSFDPRSASGDGSDISSVSISNSSFINNNATSGGGVFLEQIVNAIVILGSELRGNAASEDGGAILANRSSSCDIRIDNNGSRRSQFVMNQAGGSGGAVFATNAFSFTSVNANFTGNMAMAGGGGISTGNTGPVNVTANAFVGNSADVGGAGTFADTTGFLPPFTDVANTLTNNVAFSVPDNNFLVTGFTQ